MLTGKARNIWDGLVEYYDRKEMLTGHQLNKLKNAILLCLPAPAKQGGFDFFGRFIDTPAFAQEAEKYREDFHDLLRNLSSYSQGDPRGTLPESNRTFLSEHLNHVRLTLDVVPLGQDYYADPSEYIKLTESEKYHSQTGKTLASPLGVVGLSFGGQDIADPLCEFILREIERTRESGERLPVFACSVCDKLFVPDRVKKATNKFCSRKCKYASYGKAEKSTRTVAQFLQRLAKLTPVEICQELVNEEKRNKYEKYMELKDLLPPRSKKHIEKIKAALATRATVAAGS